MKLTIKFIKGNEKKSSNKVKFKGGNIDSYKSIFFYLCLFSSTYLPLWSLEFVFSPSSLLLFVSSQWNTFLSKRFFTLFILARAKLCLFLFLRDFLKDRRIRFLKNNKKKEVRKRTPQTCWFQGYSLTFESLNFLFIYFKFKLI